MFIQGLLGFHLFLLQLPEEDVRGYKKLVLEWEDKYHTSELELGAAREEIVVLKNENQHLKTQVAILVSDVTLDTYVTVNEMLCICSSRWGERQKLGLKVS